MEQPMQQQVAPHDWTAATFWPLWWVTLALQALDVVSVALAGKLDAAESNPVVLYLEARYGLAVAVAFKTITFAALLGLLLGWYELGRVWRIRALSAICLAFVGGLALYSAVVLWSNVGVVLR